MTSLPVRVFNFFGSGLFSFLVRGGMTERPEIANFDFYNTHPLVFGSGIAPISDVV